MFTPSSQNPAFFITISTYYKTKVFIREDLCKIIIESLQFCEYKYNFHYGLMTNLLL